MLTPVYNTIPDWLRACIESVRQPGLSGLGALPGRRWLDGQGHAGGARRSYEGDPRIRIVRLAGKRRHLDRRATPRSNWRPASSSPCSITTMSLRPMRSTKWCAASTAHPTTDFVYSDEDKLGRRTATRCDPYFKPDWSPDISARAMYTCHLLVLRTSLVRELGGFRRGFDGSQDYDLVLRVDRAHRSHPSHPADPLSLAQDRRVRPPASGLAKTVGARRRRTRAAGSREAVRHSTRSCCRARTRPLPRAPSHCRQAAVSIVLPTAGRTRAVGDRTIDLLVQLRQLDREQDHVRELRAVIADDGELPEATAAYLESMHERAGPAPALPAARGRLQLRPQAELHRAATPAASTCCCSTTTPRSSRRNGSRRCWSSRSRRRSAPSAPSCCSRTAGSSISAW